jgi:hypothetical protein
MTYRFLGAWKKGEIGLEAKTWKDGTSSTEDFLLCHNDQVAALLLFLHDKYPDKYQDFQKAINAPASRGAYSEASYRVLSSDGVTRYTVTNQEGRWTCTCVGFSYRNTCKHVDSVRSSL